MDRYSCVMADPPWQFRNKIDMADGVDRSAMSQYSTMDVEGIKWFLRGSPTSVIKGTDYDGRIMLEDAVADDAILLLWAPSSFIVDGTATAVARAWGFEPKQLVHWVKGRHTPERFVLQVGMGRYSRNCTESFLLCTKGKCSKLIQDHGVPNVIIAPRGRHSAKPDEAFRWAERLLPGPRLSIFERTMRDGWDAIGDEL
jgi:hypothetical protein